MIIESTILGTVTGLLGNVFTSVVTHKNKRMEQDHELKMRQMDLKERDLESDIALKLESAHLKRDIEAFESEMYKESISSENANTEELGLLSQMLGKRDKSFLTSALIAISSLAEILRSVMRPLLTLYFVILTSYLTHEAIVIIQHHGKLFTQELANNLFTRIVDIIVYLTVSCVTWWFGDRRLSKVYAKRLESK